MAEQITLDLGFKTFEVKDPDGNVAGVVRFNPADPGFVGRWQQVMQKVESYRQKIQEMADSDTPEMDRWTVLMEASDAIQRAFDYAFAAPVSQVFFGGASAFAMTSSGRTVLENVLEGVYPVIGEALRSAADKAQTRMKAHTSPYEGTARGLAPGQAAVPAGKQ